MSENPDNSVLAEYWKVFIKGNEAAFAHIHNMLFDWLFNYALKMQFGDEELSDDCVQELFVKLWIKKEKLPEVKSVKGYMITSMRRHILNNIRSRHLQELKVSVTRQPDIECKTQYINCSKHFPKDRKK